MDSASVSSQRLLDEGFDLPRINTALQRAPLPVRVGRRGGDSGWFDRIVKGDVAERTTTAWASDGCYPGEPVFVAEPGAGAEDAGVLLSVVLDASSGSSFLLVLDAATLDELARAEVPRHIPFGFHGQFAAA